MVCRAFLLVIALGSIAPAQPAEPPPPPPTSAPGQVISPYPGQQPIVQPPPPPPTVMSRRWAIGVDVGPESYKPDVAGAQKTDFGQLELAARYRVKRAIELGLALHLGGADNNIAEGGLYFDFRYRFMAERPLNVYALASLGVLSVADDKATDEQKRGRGSLRLGVGGEYRWSWFALIVELRLLHVGQHDDGQVEPLAGAAALSHYKLSGGSLAMGANFYF